MDNLDNNSGNGSELINRIIWVDPNLSNNRMVNSEDLTIKVEFSTQRKKRSVLFSGQALNNTGGDEAKVTFIEGSKVSDNEQPSLTTRYTDAIELEVINGNNQKNDDFESLGIESIDIEFNTAFQPIIKINFIDVRGQSILEQGSDSKYRMFFELPYPIYNLKIKGFYGKTVNYCLHMQRWNASFNSNTGNFEIQADFLGYTYAVLTDMILGLVRASVRTEQGQKIFQNKKNDYGQNSDLVLTIDEMLKRLIELNFSVKKISSETGDAAELQSYDKVYDIIDKMNTSLTKLMGSLESPYFNDNNYYVCAPKSSEDKFKTALEEYNSEIDKLVNDINLNLDGSFKFDKSALKKIVKINNISKNKLKSATIKDDIINNGYYYPTSQKRYNNDNDSSSNIDNMLQSIGDLSTSQISNDIEFDIYNFKFIRYDINVTKTQNLEKKEKETEKNLIEDLRNVAITTLGFEPTIRNIFRVLSINTEIFLEVLRDVSLKAEENSNRKNEFGKLINPSTSSFNIQTNDLNNLNIYPWPEYRAKNNSNPNDGFVESWLGSAPGIDSTKIDEVVFTNEMHQKLLDVARFDNELNNLINDLEAGLDVDKVPFVIENPWFPVSVADTPIDPRMVQNPYLTALEEERTVESVQRLLLMRTFLLLGVSTLNGKMEDGILYFMGRAEAENFLAACRKLGPEGQTILNLYLNLEGADVKTYNDRVIGNFGLNGSDKIKNPLKEKKRPIMVRVLENGDPEPNQPTDFTKVYYKYTYIIDNKTKASYIPVNKGFSGIDFYNPTSQSVTVQGNSLLPTIEVSSNFKTNSQLKELSNDIIFVSNPINWKSLNGNVTKFYKEDDGSLHTKIYELSEYESKSMIPSSEVYNEYLSVLASNEQTDPTRNVLNIDNYTSAVISNDESITTLLNPNLLIRGFQPYHSQYTSPEFKELNYNSDGGKFGEYIGEPKWGGGVNNDSSLLAFYTQNSDRDVTFPKYGTYLVKVGKIDPKIISTVNPSTIFSETLGNQFINNQNVTLFSYKAFMGSGKVIDGSPRGFWVDKLDYNLQNKNLLNLKIKNTLDVYLPFIEYGAEKTWDESENRGTYNISLFGSYHYYSQISNEVKALLFLHTIPWQGVKTLADDINEFLMFDKIVDWGDIEVKTSDGDIKQTRIKSIKTLFQVHGGFIHVPKAWILFIGGILWRLNQNEDPIFYGNKNKTLIDPTYKPSSEQYMYYCSQDGNDDSPDRKPWGLYYGNVQYDKNKTDNKNYVLIDKTLRFLPKQIRDEFINYFTNWVNSQDGFIAIQNELELFKNANQLDLAFDDLIDKVSTTEVDNRTTNKISLNAIYQHIDKNVVDNYDLIAPSENGLRYNFTTVLKPNTSVMNSIVSLLVTPTVIQNVNPNIWNYNPYNEYNIGSINNELGKRFGYEGEIGSVVSPSKAIRVRGDKMRTFINSFHTQLIAKKEDFLKEKLLTDDDITNIEIFGTSDDKTIKLQIYRTLSSINDKWINGSPDSNVFSRCGAGTGNNEKHLKHSKKYRINGDNTTSLIDTFRFIDRAFRDIGDKFFIDINKVTNLIKHQYNKSFFDVSNQILTDNNFNFIPLPNFINFNNKTELESIFKPYSYNNEVTFDGTGPSFICCYVGQTSTNLDLGLNSMYPDDGFSINRGENLPDDFEGVPDVKNGDMYVPVFSVNYGQQNQNYFKNVKLDQREFAETMESLEIIEDLSQTGDKSKATFAGNNLFNVYQTRSYSAEVEMLGSAMIQPMMYFQLNNIPMFRGAYLIYKVNHKITPHNMVTTFKGNRVKRTKTPLLDEATLYMNLVGTQSGGRIGSSRSSGGYYPPVVLTIKENGGTNGNVEVGYIELVEFIAPKGVLNNVPKERSKMISEATKSLKNMLSDFVKFAEEKKYPKIGDNYIGVTSLYRSYEYQLQLYNKSAKDGSVAPPGTSNHSWGIAVDLLFLPQDDGIYLKKNNWAPIKVAASKEGFNFKYNPSLKWFLDNGYKYGFVIPYNLRDSGGIEEYWHFEYHGTSAKCLIEKNPNVYGYKIDTSDTLKSFVKNPKDSTGKEAIYTNCDYKKINSGDGSDGVYIGGNNCPNVTTVNDTSKRVEPKKVYNIAKNIFKELNKTSLSGMLGHFKYESNFNPTAYNSSGGGCGAFGIAQWRGDRFKNLETFAIGKNKKIDDIGIQLEFIKEELQSNYKNVWNLLIGNNLSLLQATAIVHISFGLGNSNPNEYYKKITDQSEYLRVYSSKNGKTPQTLSKRYKNAEEFFNITS
jgi:LAS superfamily LD-carboxypeptidase LdcB